MPFEINKVVAMMDSNSTIRKLNEIADPAKFERLATAEALVISD